MKIFESRIRLFSGTILLPAILLSSSAFGVVGQRTYTLRDANRNRTLETFVWYPAIDSAKPEVLKKAGPFQPVVAAKDAAIDKKVKHPVVLLSHGSGGTADKLFWMAHALVQNNYIVIAVNHPGNMTADNSGKGLIEVWTRPGDLSFALDEVLKQPEFKDNLDLNKIGAVGHSAGGTTALLLAGARFSTAQFTSPVPNCKGTKDPYFSVWCNEIEKIDLKKYQKDVAKDYRDPRVKVAVGLDPGFAKSFDRESLQKIKDNLYLFIAGKLFTPFDEIYSKDFVSIVGKKSSEVVPNAVHFSFLQACKPGFPKDDPELRELCANNEEKIKIQKHAAEKTVEFLNLRLL